MPPIARSCRAETVKRTGGTALACRPEPVPACGTGGHHWLMQTQRRRDEKTLDMFSALLVFVGVLAIGGAAMWLARLSMGLPEGLASDLWTPLVVLAAASALAYLVRHRRPQ